ncbi:MAG: ADP-forming succinate--CoA ligase subunit beta [Planctomycetes bacterium]|nr:ADP-forming succinate--CoA ligase subunit beta [Planctomycetota bacterium]
MKIHEFQAKSLLARYGVPVSEGHLATSVEQAVQAFRDLRVSVAVVKAQIHAGGRGKAGGVKLVRSEDECRAAAQAILGSRLVTHQTGPAGQLVRRLWIEKGSEIAKEYYLGIALDREQKKPVVMMSSEGGVDIEEVAARHPEKIVKVAFSPSKGLSPTDVQKLVRGVKMAPGLEPQAARMLPALAKLYCELDCSIAEINPLIVTKQNQLLALDAKIVFDGNALFRHPDLVALRDLDEEDPKEIEASKYDLSYIALDGDIGCMVNGAGLAMATMDVIQLYGGSPANFLDVGGGATAEKVTAAFRILLGDAQVKGVLVNIFGGIMKCDVIATGVIAAARGVDLKVPLVVRLEGTNVELGRKMLAESGLPIVSGTDLDDAAQKICAAVAAARQ